MTDQTHVTLDDLEVVKAFSATPNKGPPSVVIGFSHFAGRAARLGVPNPRMKTAAFLLSPELAELLAADLLAAAREAKSPSIQ